MSNSTFEHDHAWFREQIATALAGGLSADEQARFDAHAAACASCREIFEAARSSDAALAAIFEDAQPRAGLEDRVIQSLRAKPARRMRISPAIVRAVSGVAAVIVVAATGYVVTNAIDNGTFVAMSERIRSASNVREIGHAALLSSNENSGGYPTNITRSRGTRSNGSSESDFTNASTFYLDGRSRSLSETRGLLGDKPSGGGGGIGAGDRETVKELSTETLNYSGGTTTVNGGILQLGTEGVNRYGDQNGRAAGAGEDRARGANVVKEGGGKEVHGLTINGAISGTANWGTNSGKGDFYYDFNNSAKGAPAQQGNEQGQQHGQQGNDNSAWYKPQHAAEVDQKREDKKRDVADLPDAVALAVPKAESTPAPGQPAAPADVEALGNAQVPPPPTTQPGVASRKVIHSANMEFEVDRFDAAFAQVVNLTREAGGYVGSTNSEKLPNGKVKGAVSVRVPPNRLDTLVLQLRGIGDLRSQKLDAEDITKQYTDLESQLRAARAMEERLLGIIKEGKGQIKDLLAAEKELGEWRTKIETIVGQQRYYDNLVGMATLNLTLYEKDIKTPATAYEAETIDAGVETEDVEKSRADALKAIEGAKGRIVQSDLKRYDAGQFAATIVAEVSPDAAGPLLDRLKQLGKMARLDVQRKQTTDSNASPAPSGSTMRVEKRDTRINLSLYNLANVAPRETIAMNLAAEDIEAAYRAILDRVVKAGGRVVTSNLNRNKPEQTTGTISFEVRTPEADAVTGDVKALGEVMTTAVSENPDTNNVTTAKKLFNVQLFSAAGVPPRETAAISLAATSVRDARQALLDAATAAKARILTSQLNESDRNNVTARLDMEVRRDAQPALEKALAAVGDTIARSAERAAAADNTIDTKVRYQITLSSADRLPPRETTTLAVELSDVEAAMGDIQSAAENIGGRTVDSNLSKQRDGRSVGRIAVEVPLEKSQEIVTKARGEGAVRAVESSKNAQVPAGKLARARIDITFGTADTLVEPGKGFWATVRNGLATSVTGLLWSLQIIIVGLCFVLPWVVVIAIAWRLWKRRPRAGTQIAPAT